MVEAASHAEERPYRFPWRRGRSALTSLQPSARVSVEDFAHDRLLEIEHLERAWRRKSSSRSRWAGPSCISFPRVHVADAVSIITHYSARLVPALEASWDRSHAAGKWYSKTTRSPVGPSCCGSAPSGRPRNLEGQKQTIGTNRPLVPISAMFPSSPGLQIH